MTARNQLHNSQGKAIYTWLSRRRWKTEAHLFSAIESKITLTSTAPSLLEPLDWSSTVEHLAIWPEVLVELSLQRVANKASADPKNSLSPTLPSLTSLLQSFRFRFPLLLFKLLTCPANMLSDSFHMLETLFSSGDIETSGLISISAAGIAVATRHSGVQFVLVSWVKLPADSPSLDVSLLDDSIPSHFRNSTGDSVWLES